jgi:hypothetical protein
MLNLLCLQTYGRKACSTHGAGVITLVFLASQRIPQSYARISRLLSTQNR